MSKTQIKPTDKRCGNCKHWMTQQCPKEPKDKSKVHPASLPSCNQYPCSSYEISNMYEMIFVLSSLTDKQKLEGLRYAKDRILLLRPQASICEGLIQYLIHRCRFERAAFTIDEIQKTFDLKQFQPFDSKVNELWFPYDDEGWQQRIKILDQLISDILKFER